MSWALTATTVPASFIATATPKEEDKWVPSSIVDSAQVGGFVMLGVGVIELVFVTDGVTVSVVVWVWV